MKVFVFLTQVIVVYSYKCYVGEERQQTTTSIATADASKPISATSSIQCILKCKRKLMDGYFVKERSECFCSKSENQEIFSDENSDGIFIQEHEVKIFILLTNQSVPILRQKCSM